MPPTSEPTGTITTAEDLFIEGAPEIWFGGVPQYSPDADGFYHGITGVDDGDPTHRVYKLGCYENFRFSDNIQMNEIRCDTTGLEKTSQTRDYLTATFDLKSLLPLTELRHLIRAGAVTWNDAENSEKMGIGEIDNTLFYMCFFSRVYDPTAGDFVSVTGHRCQFTGNFQLQTPYANAWSITGVEIRFYADNDKPDDQRFATVVRVDASAL
jgi:hypothetical protein